MKSVTLKPGQKFHLKKSVGFADLIEMGYGTESAQIVLNQNKFGLLFQEIDSGDRISFSAGKRNFWIFSKLADLSPRDHNHPLTKMFL